MAYKTGFERTLILLSQLFAVALTIVALYLSGAGFFNDLIKSAGAIFPDIRSVASGVDVPDSIIISGGTVVLGLLVMLLSGAGVSSSGKQSAWPKMRSIIDLILAFLFVAVMVTWFRIMFAQEEFFIEISQFDDVTGWIAFAILGWATWRFFGLPMVLVYLFAIIYVLAGDYLPWIFRGSSEHWTRVAENLWFSTDGAFGRPVEVVSRVVLIYIIFGAVLQASGAGKVLLKFAYAATGRFAGGPAHASIVGSAMFGTMSGAAVANVVSTGVFTIPIIKRAGFRATFAGAVEAAASTGGQIMPPVMGVVAFLMADITGLPYLKIILAAAIPAALYYISLFIVVLIEARKEGMKPTPKSEIASLTKRDWLQSMAFFVPLVVIIAVLITGRTPQLAGFAALLAGLVLSLLLFPEFRNMRVIWGALVSAGKTCASIMVIVTAIGVVIGVINMTGVGLKFAEAILSLSGESLFFSLILVMFACLFMGMGVPTGAAYLIIAIVMGPALAKLGLPVVVAHLFVVYFGVLSAVTPPVALAAFAAAPIAGSSPMATGFEATRLAIAGFLIPFAFVYHPELVLIEGFSILGLGWALIAFLIATWSIATGLAGFESGRLPLWQRIVRLAAGLAVLVPAAPIAAPAAALAIAMSLFHKMQQPTADQKALN